MKLPIEVFAERRSVRKKLLKARGVFLIFDLLRAISGIEIVLKFAAKIYFVERIRVFARRLVVAICCRPMSRSATPQRLGMVPQNPGQAMCPRQPRRRSAVIKSVPKTVGVLIENIFRDLLDLVAWHDLFENRI